MHEDAVRRYLSTITPWRSDPVETIAETRIVGIRAIDVRSRRHPERGGRFTQIAAPDWVNIVPLVRGKGDVHSVVMVEQWRAGIEAVTLELPGGMVDSGEDPIVAGVREVREETGYAPIAGVSGRHIGRVSSNPALMTNWTHSVLLDGVEPAPGGQSLDGSEEIAVHLVPLEEVPGLIRAGVIHHSLVVAAFHHLALHDPGVFWKTAGGHG